MVKRTEAQVKKDRELGINELEYVFNPTNGKIEQLAKVRREFDPEQIMNGIEAYEEKVKEMEEFIRESEDKLKVIGHIAEDEELQRFNEMIEKVALLKQKKSLEEVLEKKREELIYETDTLNEQKILVLEYKAWKKGRGKE